MRGQLACAIVAAWFLCASAEAGIVVLSGDSTPAFHLTDTEPSPSEPGNRGFFANVLGAGQDVVVLNTANNVNRAPIEINEYYSTLPGKTSVRVTGPITPAHLAGKELLVISVPSADFTAAEVSAIGAFLVGGGSIFAMGEADAIDFGVPTNLSINALFSALQIPMFLELATHDIGLHIATAAPHPLTAGLGTFRYGATTRVTGGTPLYYTSGGGTQFIAVVPEPTSLGLIIVLAAAQIRRPARVTPCRRGSHPRCALSCGG